MVPFPKKTGSSHLKRANLFLFVSVDLLKMLILGSALCKHEYDPVLRNTFIKMELKENIKFSVLCFTLTSQNYTHFYLVTRLFFRPRLNIRKLKNHGEVHNDDVC